MKKYIIFLILSAFTVSLFAQDTEEAKEKDKPVSETFSSGYLIDNQTVFIPDAKTLEFIIQHKFGTIDNGWSDLFGIYAAGSNIRLGLNYVPVKNLQLGVGVTKKNMYTDVNAKWSVLKQTERSSIPVSVTLFGSAAVDGRNESAFGTGKVHHPGEGLSQYSIGFSDRMSYFSQLIIARKFSSWLSLQAGASFTHYNMVAAQYDHDVVGLHFNGRVKISPQSSLIFNYDAPLKITDISEQSTWIDKNHPTSNLCFGIEISTFTHAFQIYVGTADGILPQDNMMWNRND
ncbi:MAG TPA: DUF5777 family beta-barrel protein, partial [Draconibacterium sp.]|nr:DUF5777 family beta-barrel protein [Draconibacterium sp.]